MNIDQKRRDEIMCFEEPTYVGGLQPYEDLTAEQLEMLAAEDFVGLADPQGPLTTQDFLNFMKQHPDTNAHGFVISADRSDYRLVIEGLVFLGRPNAELKNDFKAFCSTADDLKIGRDELYAWWAND